MLIIKKLFIMSDISRLSLDIADLPLTPFGMRSPPVRGIHHRITSSNKLSRNRLKSPASADEKMQLTNLPSRIHESNKENTEHATQAKQIPDKKCLWSKPKDPAIRKLMPALRKPTFYMKTNSKMPALLEENSEDIFIIPEIPKKIAHKLKSTPISKAKPSQPMRNINAILTCQDNVNTNSVGVYGSSSASSSQVCSNDAHSHPIHPTAESTNSRSNLFDNTEMSSIGPTKPQKVLSSTRVEERNNNRRESTMTDIDDGSFVEFTREIPEGRVIPHIDSVTKLRDNLYFTTYSQPNETKYSTSSKLPNARYGFHNLVDAIKKQKLLQQISQENCESSESKTPESALMLPENEPVISGSADVMKALRGPKYKLLNSTMIGDKRQSQYPLCVPDVSTLSTNETTVDDSIPLNTNRLLRPTPVVTKSPEPQNVKTNTCLPSRKAEVSNYSKIVTQSKSPIRNNQQNNIVKGKNEQHMAFQRVELDDSLISEDVSLADSEQCDGIIPQPNLQYNQQLYNNKSQKNSKSVSNIQEPDKSNTNKHSNQKKNKAVGNVVTVPESEKESGKSGSIEEIPPSPTALVKPASTETRYRMYDTPVKFKPEQNNEVFKHKNDSASVTPRLDGNNTNALPPSSPCVVKPSVYQWVANSPFKDGSFDTSFLRQGPTLTASNQLKSSVLETSSEDELECSLNKVQVDSKKKKQTGGNLDIKTKKTNEKRSGGRKNKYNSTVLNTPSKICSQKVPPLRPENSASSSKSNTNTDSDSKYADSLEMESLRLRLEASTYSAKTSLTIGRVATSPTANECPAAIPVKAGTLSTKILADSDSSDTDASQLPSNSNTKRKKKRMSLNNIVISSLHKKIPINIKSTRETDKKPVSIPKKRNKNNNSDLSQPPESSCASPTLKNNQNVMNSHLNKHGQTSLGRRFDSPRKNKSDGESSDDISNYMKKWRGKKATNISSDESDDSFVVDDNCDDSDDESFFLPSLSERLLVDNKLNNKKRQDKGSVIDHSLKKNGETEKSRKCLLPKTPVVYALSDSYEDLPSPQPKSVLQTPGSQVIILSDSDDEPARAHRPKPFMTPLPNKTFKATTKKTLICPNTVGPSKPSVNLKIFSYQSMASTYGTPTMSFLSSLSIHPGNNRLHPEAVLYTKNFSKTRDGLVTKLYKLFNKEVFESKLPEDMKVTWNVRMRKTAGFCYYQVDRSRPNGRGSRIELSAKVVDNSERLRDTFAHELCHAAAWIISGYKDGHGPLWKAWANKTLLVFPELPSINRCHNYQISCKFTYKCTKCGYSIGRHSKSLDIERKVCGKCRGHFQLLVNSKTQLHGTATPRTPGPFALFVKDNYGDVKKSGSDLKHNEVMKLLGEKFKELRT